MCAVNRAFCRRVLRVVVGCQLNVSLARLAGGALLFACAKSKQKHTKEGLRPLFGNSRSGRNHRGVGSFLSLDTLEQRQSPVLCSVDERFLPGAVGFVVSWAVNRAFLPGLAV